MRPTLVCQCLLPKRRRQWCFIGLCVTTVLFGSAYYWLGNPERTAGFLSTSAASTARLKVRESPAGLPMVLHFVYKDTNILEAYRTSMESCIKLNSNWTVILWTDSSVRSFISRDFPQYVSVFYAFPQKIQRADAIRYLILYRFGGVYLDMDMRCRQPLLPSLSSLPCFLDREREHQTRVVHDLKCSAMNSAMGCRPWHPFFKKVLQFVFHPDRLKQGSSFPYNIFHTTGPLALTKLYDEWRSTNSQPADVKLLNESYFSPKINSNVYSLCRSVVQELSNRTRDLTDRQKACLELQALGYEKSDALFLTNLTVAVHEFTHLGYHDQSSPKFDVLTVHPGVRLYPNIK